MLYFKGGGIFSAGEGRKAKTEKKKKEGKFES